MSSDRKKSGSENVPAPVPGKAELLSRALGQSEQVQDKVERAAVGLFSVNAVLKPCEIDGLNLTLKASIGIALYPEGGRSALDLLKNADEAMYLAKQQKQGPVFFQGKASA